MKCRVCREPAVIDIRRHNANVPVFLCTESPELWREFGPELGMTPGSYICACGPQTPPGARGVPNVWVPVECA